MSAAADKALAAIDAGLQRSPEAAYGDDLWPELCARCQFHPHADAGDGDLCDGCRAFLLGDNDTDPADTHPVSLSEVLARLQADLERVFAPLQAACARAVEAADAVSTLYLSLHTDPPDDADGEASSGGYARRLVAESEVVTFSNMPPVTCSTWQLFAPSELGAVVGDEGPE